MGKNSKSEDTGLSLGNHRPGFVIWGMLHHLHHYRWHYGKKRLTRKPHGSSKLSTDEGSTKTTSDASEAQDSVRSSVENYAVGTKPVVPHPPHKNSMKSRIKALLADEMSRRKGRGRHRRSTSCPMQAPLDQTIVIHHPESSSGPGLLAVSRPKPESCHSHLPGPSEENGGRSPTCQLCATMLKLNYLKQSEVSRFGWDPVRDHTLLQDKLVYAIEQSKCDSLQESKLFMDALDLLDLRKEVFLKILQDPSSALAHQIQCRRAPGERFGLTKSVSFPSRGLSFGIGFEAEKGGSKLELPANVMKKRDKNNKVALKHFKNLREKIKHVIWDRKKEKNRIIMDAVHHKIPFGQRVSKKLSSGGEISCYSNKGGKLGKQQVYKRTSSFNESYDKYNRLLDISSNKEAKACTNGTLKRRTTDDDNNCHYNKTEDINNTNSRNPSSLSRQAVLKRILSLPDMRSYPFSHLGDSCDTSLVHATDGANLSSRLTEEKSFELGLEISAVGPHAVTESVSHEKLDVGSSLNESVDSKTWETASSHDLNVEVGPATAPQPLDSGPVSEDELSYQEDEIGPVTALEDSKFPMEGNPNPPAAQLDSTNLNSRAIEKLYSDLVHFHVDPSNKAEFNYVKDILDLSGLMRDDPLGRWHSAAGPVDPSVFDEVEGPECSENETWDNLLLFDLVNEVLLDIHNRSFQYWPRPLAVQSSVHLMPRGQRVLEEVWAEIEWLLSRRPEVDQSIDEGVGRGLGKGNRWMNVQTDAEFVGVEVEDLIFDDLLEEIVSN
ncbi:Protein of unknown function (DUF3741 [Striga hermonthica]|uniref:DUF4378 domain-containing protein n=1 Tax=Striga hermonthica TaxID=68872 RepID=A0A9N7RSJ6_STRHE|nr:Protein of unknown function (DUF3741 [Striga hermonthica]